MIKKNKFFKDFSVFSSTYLWMADFKVITATSTGGLELLGHWRLYVKKIVKSEDEHDPPLTCHNQIILKGVIKLYVNIYVVKKLLQWARKKPVKMHILLVKVLL